MVQLQIIDDLYTALREHPTQGEIHDRLHDVRKALKNMDDIQLAIATVAARKLIESLKGTTPFSGPVARVTTPDYEAIVSKVVGETVSFAKGEELLAADTLIKLATGSEPLGRAIVERGARSLVHDFITRYPAFATEVAS